MDEGAVTRHHRNLQLVGVASGCGAPDQGCGAGADTLRGMQLSARLRTHGLRARWTPMIRPSPFRPSHTLRAVRKVCTTLARRVERITQDGDLPVVLGGDHTSAIGTWKGVALARLEHGRIGLLWIDAHMDAHTPQTTESGMLHGMPVACLLGQGYSELTAIAHGVTLDPACVCLYGVRSFESGEAELLRRLGVRVYFMEEIVARGISETLDEALGIVSCASGGFGVTLDLDAIDPGDAPGVGSPAMGGMRAPALMTALARHGGDERLVGLEIVEYNPARDRESATAELVADAIEAVVLGKADTPANLPVTD